MADESYAALEVLLGRAWEWLQSHDHPKRERLQELVQKAMKAAHEDENEPPEMLPGQEW